MGLLDGYFDPEQFQASGGLLGRLRSLQGYDGQYGPVADPDSPNATANAQPPPWSQMLAPFRMRVPNLPGYVQPVSDPQTSALASANPGAGKPQFTQIAEGPQVPGTTPSAAPLADGIKSTLLDFYNQTILKAGKDIAGYAADAATDPEAFARGIGPSLPALGPLAGELPAAIRAATGMLGLLRPADRIDYGDLTSDEVRQIQSVVNEAGRPLEVVGSAAKGSRAARSDIDYVVPPSSMQYYQQLQNRPEAWHYPWCGKYENGSSDSF
jgi:hypothetical protein